MDSNDAGQEIVNEVWRDLIKPHEKTLTLLQGPLALANLFAHSMSNAKNAGLKPTIPVAAEEWAEGIFETWFEIMGKIATSSGIRRRLLDRGLYDPLQDDAPDWSEGLTLDILDPIDRENEEWDIDDEPDILEEYYGPYGTDARTIMAFGGKTTDARLHGQYNRLFPVKLVLRTAANLILSREEYKLLGEDEGQYEYDELLLEDLREECLNVAKYAKKRFQWIDLRSGKKMGEKFAVGLTDGSKKQNERFVAQFVGSVRNKGCGLPFELGLLCVDEEGAVQFTKTGVNFMLLENPMFDTLTGWKDGQVLSEQEKISLIQIIKLNLPEEYQFMVKIVGWIEDSVNRPKMIEEKIINDYSVSKTEGALMRSGVLARMIELGLVSRNQLGREVTYILTNKCSILMN